MNEFIAIALTYLALGALAVALSHEIAPGLNRFSVWFYDMFPVLKKAISLSRFAGSPRNYKTGLYFLRVLGVMMMLFGVVLLGLVMLRR